MARIFLEVYQRPAQGNARIKGYEVTQYRHKITAIGGFMTASCRLVVEQSEAERIFRDFIGCRVAVYADNPIIPIWEGYISRAVIDSGAVQLSKSMDRMYNSALVQFTDGTGMLPEQTTKATDADSIAIYGEKQTTIDAGELYSTLTTFAEAIRDQVVGVKAFPIVTPLSGSSQQGGIYIEMRGFAETLKWDTFAVDNNAATNIAAQILTTTGTSYTNNSGVFYDDTYTGEISTHVSAPGTRELGESSWDMLLNIVESGDYVFGISPTNPNAGNRIAYFRDANRDIEYTIDAYGDGRIYSLFGLEVLPQWVRPDRGIRINNIALADADTQEAYLTEVDYDAESNRVQWYTDENSSFEGVFNFDQFAKPVNERFGATRRMAAVNSLSPAHGGTGADNSTGADNQLLQRNGANGSFEAVSSIDASLIGSGVLANARVNFAAPSAIGSTTPAAGTFTTLIGSSIYTGQELNYSLAAGGNENHFTVVNGAGYIVVSHTINSATTSAAVAYVQVANDGTITIHDIIMTGLKINTTSNFVRTTNNTGATRSINTGWIRVI